MSSTLLTRAPDRSRLGWWLLTLAIAGALAFVLHAFVGTFVFGVFIYYGMRPLARRLRGHLSPGTAAAASLLAVALPALVLVGSVVAIVLQEFSGGVPPPVAEALSTLQVPAPKDLQGRLSDLGGSTGSIQGVLTAGAGVLAFLAGGLLHLFIAVTVAFYLLRDDRRLAGWFRENVAGEGTPAHAYASAVDRDLATIYFGNVVLVGMVAVLATVVYHGFNLLAPDPLAIPLPTALAVLTGLACLVPVVVSKLVYVPLSLYLAAVAVRSDPALLVYPLALAGVSLVALDLVPMGLLLPKVAGRKTHVGLVLLAYILGPVLFGWYGLFLGPLLLVLGVQLVRIPFTELLHDEPITPRVTAAESIGADPPAGAAGIASGGSSSESSSDAAPGDDG